MLLLGAVSIEVAIEDLPDRQTSFSTMIRMLTWPCVSIEVANSEVNLQPGLLSFMSVFANFSILGMNFNFLSPIVLAHHLDFTYISFL
jgi:hypothetical protein